VELNPVLIVVGMGLAGLLGWWRVFPHLRSLQTTETSRDGVWLALIGYVVMSLVVWLLAGQLQGASLVRLMTLQALACLLGVGAMLILAGRRRAGLSALGLRTHRGPPAPLVAVFAWLAFFPIFLVIVWLNQKVLGSMGVEIAVQNNLQRFLDEDGARTSILAWTAMIAVIPACEELIFRGGLFGGMRRALHPMAAMLISSVLFGLMHEPTYLVPTAALGFALAFLYECTGSLSVPFLFHGLHNGLTLLIASLYPDSFS
jgi:membrane protease YdiL (CAAX protease family)